MLRKRPSGAIVVAVAVTLIAIALGGARNRAGTETLAARCDGLAAVSAERGSAPSGAEADLLVIGDSWSVGLGLPDPAAAWPSRLPGRVHVAGFSGSGYGRTSSPCDGASFAARAVGALGTVSADAPVVVEGGLNDWDATDAAITLGFEHLMRVLRGHPVIVLGPPLAPARAAFMGRVQALLERLSTGAGVRFVPTSQLDLVYQPDGLHPTPAGQQEFGDAVAAALATS